MNDDGFADLGSHYRSRETGITKGDTQACLTATLTSGGSILGCDSVNGEKQGHSFLILYVVFQSLRLTSSQEVSVHRRPHGRISSTYAYSHLPMDLLVTVENLSV